MIEAAGVFKQRYQPRGRDWVRRMEAEDRKVWAALGRLALAERGANWQSLGGQTRARAQRDQRGRFVRLEAKHGT